jgi:ribosomal protein S18 acetylase RimI-like enzyme
MYIYSQFNTKDGLAFVVHEAMPEDAPQLLVRHKAAIEERLDSLITRPEEVALSVEQERAWIGKHADADNSVLLVAEKAGKIIGWAGLQGGKRIRTRHTALLHITVARRWRGRGIGTALMEVLLAWAAKNPTVEKVKLAVVASNHRALKLYHKLGFQQEGFQPREYKKADGTYLDNLLMYRLVG